MVRRYTQPRIVRPERISLKGQLRTVGSLFLDSGAHSLYTLEVIDKKHKQGYNYYYTSEFKKFVNKYARFVKQRSEIDLYANVDVIFNPELSWKVLKYLENEYGLNPLPVIHYGTPIKWVEKHLNAGYKYLGIGGLGQEATRTLYMNWADKLFSFICPKSNDYKPIVKTHGFAMTSTPLITKYPWRSVDSGSWAQGAGAGNTFVPYKGKKEKWDFTRNQIYVGCTPRSPSLKIKRRHWHTMSPGEKAHVLEWLKYIGMPLGKIDKNGRTVEYGILSEYNARAVANLRFYEKLTASLPNWPWSFIRQNTNSLFRWQDL